MMGPRAAGRSANQKMLLAEQVIEAVEEGYVVTLSRGSGTINISLSGPNQFTSTPTTTEAVETRQQRLAEQWADIAVQRTYPAEKE